MASGKRGEVKVKGGGQNEGVSFILARMLLLQNFYPMLPIMLYNTFFEN